MRPSIDYAGIVDLYDSFVRFDDDIPFFLDVTRPSGADVLELMAGTGRVSLPLLEAGVRLISVDYTPAMLRVLRDKAAGRGLPARLVVADARALPFRARFALAILPFHSFSELVEEDDQMAALTAVRDALVEGGRFVCTLHNPAVRLRAIDGTLRELGSCPHPSGRGTVVVLARFQHDPNSGQVSGVQQFELRDDEGRVAERRSMEMRFVLPDRRRFEELAGRAGFRVTDLRGDYRGSAYDERESPHMIWTLER